MSTLRSVCSVVYTLYTARHARVLSVFAVLVHCTVKQEFIGLMHDHQDYEGIKL